MLIDNAAMNESLTFSNGESQKHAKRISPPIDKNMLKRFAPIKKTIERSTLTEFRSKPRSGRPSILTISAVKPTLVGEDCSGKLPGHDPKRAKAVSAKPSISVLITATDQENFAVGFASNAIQFSVWRRIPRRRYVASLQSYSGIARFHRPVPSRNRNNSVRDLCKRSRQSVTPAPGKQSWQIYCPT